MYKKIKFNFNDKLNKEDNKNQPLVCRQKNPNICSNNGIENICAFVSKDGICKRPYQSLEEAIC